jgi:hypothetical protein
MMSPRVRLRNDERLLDFTYYMNLTIGQQLAQLSLEKRRKKLRTKKQWSDHMKQVRKAGIDKRSSSTPN